MRRVLRRVLRAAGVLACVVMSALAFLTVTGQLRLQPVLTGSMAPTYPTGTLVGVSPVVAGDVEVGDVLMFMPPEPYGTPGGAPVLHRVASMARGDDGRLQLRTKGDANPELDPWTIDAQAGGLSRLQGSSVVAGRAVRLLRSTASGPAVLLWPGVALLLVASRLPRRTYRPRHALA